MQCKEVIEHICAGVQNEAVLDHLTTCANCRAQAHATVVTLPASITSTDQVRPAPPPSRSGSKLPWILLAIVAPVVGGLVTIAVVAHPSAKEAPLPPPPPVAPEPPPPEPAIVEEPTQPKLEIDSEPQGATIFLEGKKRGATPMAIEVPSGHLLVEVRADGFRTGRKTVDIGDDPPAPLFFKLERKTAAEPTAAATPPPAAAPAAPAAPDPTPADGEGSISIATEPSAAVSIDGNDIGRKTPILRYKTPAGRHTVELRTDDGTTIKVSAVVRAGQEVRILKKIK